MRSVVERFKLEIFDRVTQIKFHPTTDLDDVELQPFTKLSRVTKAIDYSDSGIDFAEDKSFVKLMANMEKSAPGQAKKELNKVFSECQIGKITHDSATWSAEIDVTQLSCRTTSND